MQVYFVDDHALFADAITALLDSVQSQIQFERMYSFDDAIQLLESETVIDGMVVDYRMPNMNGIRGVSKLRGLLNEKPLVMISGSATILEVSEAYKADVNAFLSKSIPAESFAKSLLDVLQNETKKALNYETNCDSVLSLLTRRELEISLRIADGRTNADIADELGISEATVKAHLRTILIKSNCRNRTELAIKILKYV